MLDDTKVVGAIVGAASAVGTGTITVATITTPPAGILGAIGFTTTTTIAVPVAGVVAVGGFFCYGIYKFMEAAHSQK